MTIGKEELDSTRQHLRFHRKGSVTARLEVNKTYNALLHRKTLLVVASSDANDLWNVR